MTFSKNLKLGTINKFIRDVHKHLPHSRIDGSSVWVEHVRYYIKPKNGTVYVKHGTIRHYLRVPLNASFDSHPLRIAMMIQNHQAILAAVHEAQEREPEPTLQQSESESSWAGWKALQSQESTEKKSIWPDIKLEFLEDKPTAQHPTLFSLVDPPESPKKEPLWSEYESLLNESDVWL